MSQLRRTLLPSFRLDRVLERISSSGFSHEHQWRVKGVKFDWKKQLAAVLLYDIDIWMLAALVLAAYLAVTLLFTVLLYPALLLDPSSFSGAPENPGSALTAIFCLSLSALAQTAVSLTDVSPQSVYTVTMVVAEHFVGIFMGAILLGVLINRAAIPPARIIFSDVVLLTTRDGQPMLILRIGNIRGNFLLNPEIRVGILSAQQTVEGENIMRMSRLELDEPPALSPCINVACHITPDSALYGKSYQELEQEGTAIYVALAATDNRHFQEVFARRYYLMKDVRVNCRFQDVMHLKRDGSRSVDFSRFNRITPNTICPVSFGLSRGDMDVINGIKAARPSSGRARMQDPGDEPEDLVEAASLEHSGSGSCSAAAGAVSHPLGSRTLWPAAAQGDPDGVTADVKVKGAGAGGKDMQNDIDLALDAGGLEQKGARGGRQGPQRLPPSALMCLDGPPDSASPHGARPTALMCLDVTDTDAGQERTARQVGSGVLDTPAVDASQLLANQGEARLEAGTLSMAHRGVFQLDAGSRQASVQEPAPSGGAVTGLPDPSPQELWVAERPRDGQVSDGGFSEGLPRMRSLQAHLQESGAPLQRKADAGSRLAPLSGGTQQQAGEAQPLRPQGATHTSSDAGLSMVLPSGEQVTADAAAGSANAAAGLDLLAFDAHGSSGGAAAVASAAAAGAGRGSVEAAEESGPVPAAASAAGNVVASEAPGSSGALSASTSTGGDGVWPLWEGLHAVEGLDPAGKVQLNSMLKAVLAAKRWQSAAAKSGGRSGRSGTADGSTPSSSQPRDRRLKETLLGQHQQLSSDILTGIDALDDEASAKKML